MRRHAGVAVLVVGAAIALVAGGGLAWAGWTVGGSVGVVTVEAARIPVMARPRAELVGGSAKISWTPIELSSGRPVGGYVVLRQDGADSALACTAPANDTGCRDRAAKPGSSVTYVVHATAGLKWAGPDSPPSDQVRIPAGVNVDSTGHQSDKTEQASVKADPQPLGQETENVTTSGASIGPQPSDSVSPAASPSGSASVAALDGE